MDDRFDPLRASTDPDSLTLCCGGRRCPVITQISGDFVLEDEGKTIALTRKQAAALATWLDAKLRAPSTSVAAE